MFAARGSPPVAPATHTPIETTTRSPRPSRQNQCERVSSLSLRLGLLVGILAVPGRARARRSHEQRAPVGERDVAAVGALASILCLVARDDDHGADLDRIAR